MRSGRYGPAVPATLTDAYLSVGVRLCIVSVLISLASVPASLAAEASPSAAPFPSLSDWLQNGVWVAAAIYLLMKLFRRQPPLDRELGELSARFAAREHTHSEYLRRSDLEAKAESCAKERLTIRQASAETAERVERQIDHMRDTLGTKLDEIAANAEERSSNLHRRIDPLINTISGTASKLDNHLEDHRAGKAGGQ